MAVAQKLNVVDASFLDLEGENNHMHIGGLMVFSPSKVGKGAKLHKTVMRLVESRLGAIPRYRQRLAFVPLRLDTPVWVDDPDFDISNHIMRRTVAAPGGDREVQRVVSRAISQRLDRARPLWEMYVLEGLSRGRWAILTKTHHSMVDGIAAVDLITSLIDLEPKIPDLDSLTASDWSPKQRPSSIRLVIDAMQDRAVSRFRAMRGAPAVVGDPLRLAGAIRDTAQGLATMGQTIRVARSIFLGPTSPRRKWITARTRLDDFRLVKGVLGGTVNDVMLAAVAGGIRRHMIARGIDPAQQTISVMCPVSLRDPTAKGGTGNELAALLVELPVGETDPVKRLLIVHAAVESLRDRKQPLGAEAIARMIGLTPYTFHALATRATLSAMSFDMVVSNIPGPQAPLYCLGSKMIESFPIGFLYPGQLLFVNAVSYIGGVYFGFTCDPVGFKDLEEFAGDVIAGLRELVKVARSAQATSGGG